MICSFEKPYRLCTFSRVIKEKVIEDIVQVIEEINSKNEKNIYSLDIYGPIDSHYEDQFCRKKKKKKPFGFQKKELIIQTHTEPAVHFQVR